MNVLLTRALAQVKPLQSLVLKAEHQPLIFPTLKIQALKNTPQKKHYDVMIFISVNAVEQGLDVLKSLNYQTCKIFAVGAITAKKLYDYGFKVAAFPKKKSSSEALLAIDEVMRLRDKNILIFRGQGGRETLKQGLNQNNTVEYIEVYQRTQCQIVQNHQTVLTQFLQNKQGIVVISSVENLSSMLSMLEEINIDAVQLIKIYPLVVLSQRIKIYAQSMGFNRVEVAPQTNDAGLIEGIKLIAQT